MTVERLKWAAIVSFVIALGGLLVGGFQTRTASRPTRARWSVPTASVLFRKADILAGQDVYQRYGLMDHGSVWGHGSQRGMEFSAVSLHRMGRVVSADLARQEFGKLPKELDPLQAEVLELRTAPRDEDEPVRRRPRTP